MGDFVSKGKNEAGNLGKVPKSPSHREQVASWQIISQGTDSLGPPRTVPNTPFETGLSSGPKLGQARKDP